MQRVISDYNLKIESSFKILVTCVCMHACVHAQLCWTLCDPMDCSPPGSSVHGIPQASILKCVAISFSRGSSRPRDQTSVSGISCIGRQILYHKCHQISCYFTSFCLLIPMLPSSQVVGVLSKLK